MVEKIMDINNSHSLSTIIFPEKTKSRSESIYIRLEGFNLVMFNEKYMK
jgi:hypothetical protein